MRIALYKSNSILGKLVRLFSRGNYNHATLIFDDDSCIEAGPWKGVYKHDKYYDDITRENYIIDIYNIEQTPEQDVAMQKFANNQVGKKYDFYSFFGFILYTNKESKESCSRWMCAELVISTFQSAGINLFDRYEAWKISPTILSYSSKLKFEKKVIVSKQKIVATILSEDLKIR